MGVNNPLPPSSTAMWLTAPKQLGSVYKTSYGGLKIISSMAEQFKIYKIYVIRIKFFESGDNCYDYDLIFS